MRSAPCILLVALWLSPTSALAQQTPIVVDRLQISLWPEYDDPRLLVIYRGQLAADPQSPLVFSIPATAQVHAAAHVGSDGQLLADPWDSLPGDDGQQLVIFRPGSRLFQFEYYDALPRTGGQRSFVVRFQSSRYEVRDLGIELLQPLGASELRATPELQAQGTDELGFARFTRKAGTVPAGALVEQSVSYIRSDDEPSVQRTTAVGPRQGFPWRAAAAAAAFAVAAVGSIWLWKSRRKPQPAKEPKTASARYCAHCGHEFRHEERFCSQCGKPRG